MRIRIISGVFNFRLTKILKVIVFVFLFTYIFGDIFTTLLGVDKYGEANKVILGLLSSGTLGFAELLILKLFVFILIVSLFLTLGIFGYTKTGFYLLLSSSITGVFVCLNNILHFFSYREFVVFVIIVFSFIPIIAFFEMNVTFKAQ